MGSLYVLIRGCATQAARPERRQDPAVAYIEIAVGCRAMKGSAKPPGAPETIDEPGMEERFQRALRKALSTPPKLRTAPTPKTKERPASKGRGHKRKTRNYGGSLDQEEDTG
jgi:hypothetical protein